SGLPSNTLWTFSIDWDSDGKSDQVVTGPSGTQVDHVFPAIGSYTVSVVATDPEHRVGAPASQTEHVLAAGLRDDPLASGKTALIIGGTPGVDKIVLTPQDALGAITVTINGVNRGTFTPTGHIFVYGQAGNDVLQEARRVIHKQRIAIAVPPVLFGGAGNDVIKTRTSLANNVLVGGAGKDTLRGGSGPDLCLGGAAADGGRGGS